MSRLFFKIICKVTAILCWMRTKCAYPLTDPTQILVDHFTEAQKAPRMANGNPPSSIKIGVLIPFRNHWLMTSKCIDSLRQQKLPSHLQVDLYLINNGSDEPLISERLEEQTKLGATIVAAPGPFNFSKINNLGATKARNKGCDYLLFLNNDVEFTQENSLKELIEFYAGTKNIGALGCTLTYPNGSLQHLFAAPGVKVVAAHPLRGSRLNKKHLWYREPRIVPAVTGAVMLVSANLFEKVGGFDENLPTLGQDIDLCLKIQKAGFANWTLPKVELIHKEGTSRGSDLDRKQISYMYEKWGSYLIKNPYYSEKLSRWSERPVLTIGEPNYPWTLVIP